MMMVQLKPIKMYEMSSRQFPHIERCLMNEQCECIQSASITKVALVKVHTLLLF
jgi:hypothetical protein